MKLDREFYSQPALDLARALIGKQLVHRTAEGVTKGIIVEVEAYLGITDAASHAFGGRRTERTAVLYGPGGFAYTYTIYGMHTCMNVVAGPRDNPQCVFLRALQPTEGVALMEKRRGVPKLRQLCSGPGKLCQAMGITKAQYGADLCGDELYIEAVEGEAPEIAAAKRINIDYAGPDRDNLWRFALKDSPFVSVKMKD